MLAAIRGYQVAISPLFGTACRYYPSCSEYAAIAIERAGPARGLRLTIGRLSRCHPFSRRGGLDLP